ncbi:MAG TPA: hypothetical protein VN046_01000 [Stenotrophobium sp.]|jgi:hypothetical protein|nr:hypothetical protein [Stenotrophobium sp.]
MRGDWLIPIAALCLAGCHGGTQQSGVGASVPALSAGTHDLVLGGDSGASQGTAFIGDSGGGYIVLGSDSNAPASVVYKRGSAAQGWQRVPAAATAPQLQTRLDEVLPAAALPVLAGQYHTLIGDRLVSFTLDGAGVITSSGNDCMLSGQVQTGQPLASALRVSGQISACGGADGQYQGVLFADPDASNAAFRLVVDDGSAVRDFYVFSG